MSRTHWLILTGEYPPQSGGVADYTRLVAEALAELGDEVEIYAPPSDGPELSGKVKVHRLADHFGLRGLAELSRTLRSPDPRRVMLVQYVPHAFGYKAMNVRFCAWLLCRRGVRIWTMFHEVAYPFEQNQPLRHRFLAVVNHLMAMAVVRASERILVSTPAWGKLIGPWVKPRTAIEWAAIPSNLSGSGSSALRPTAKRGMIVAHFGTYGNHMAPVVREVVVGVLRKHPTAVVQLLGRGSEDFARSFEPAWVDRIEATGSLAADQVSAYLSTADVVLQPYPDGVTTRRSSIMAAMALGCSIVTTEGRLTESVWRENDAVALAPANDAGQISDAVNALLDDPTRRSTLQRNAKSLYDARFDLSHTISLLKAEART